MSPLLYQLSYLNVMRSSLSRAEEAAVNGMLFDQCTVSVEESFLGIG